MPPLVQPLFDGPLDIVGDVHGEIDALCSLLQHLGYDEAGVHPAGRRLVFLGDLTDRGPDSPAVVDRVRELVDAGQAQCVLGNHDLNILLDHRKFENKWFYGDEFYDEHGNVAPQRLADEPTRQRVLDFFDRLPLALERDDLRIVHACWDEAMVRAVQHEHDVTAVHDRYHRHIEEIVAPLRLDPIEHGLRHQNDNPVKRLTSGPEERAPHPRVSGGKVRHEQRVLWWNDYRDTFCVFGHYSLPNGVPRGNGWAFCADFGIGKRWTERREGISCRFTQKLAALRYPERIVVFDEGDQRPCEV